MTVCVYLRQYDHNKAEAHIFITVVGLQSYRCRMHLHSKYNAKE